MSRRATSTSRPQPGRASASTDTAVQQSYVQLVRAYEEVVSSVNIFQSQQVEHGKLISSPTIPETSRLDVHLTSHITPAKRAISAIARRRSRGSLLTDVQNTSELSMPSPTKSKRVFPSVNTPAFLRTGRKTRSAFQPSSPGEEPTKRFKTTNHDTQDLTLDSDELW